MMQIEAFPPASHTSDPISSKVAEAKVTKSGKRASTYRKVLVSLSMYPDKTAEEIKKLCVISLSEISVIDIRRRLSDAKSKGDAIQTGQRICRVAGTLATTWKRI